ncbi:histidine--tRNA ligase [Candidatus Bathyarchaeota archaeon]|nr:histidine--tRNA ligase [Candidatus Bathyarchaeota archaeon]
MFQTPRGTRDFLPAEMLKRNWVMDQIRAVFQIYGYGPMSTPAFESWDLLKKKSGEDAVNQIYYFKDKSDRELGLRFEWTASLARVVATHRELPKPFKRYAIGPVWRYERPSDMRWREFWQADVDVVGVADPIADTEVLAVAVDSLRAIGFKGFKIRLNDRRLLEALVEISGLPKERYIEAFRAIDKRGKIGDKGVLEELDKISDSKESSQKLLDLTSIKGAPSEVISKARELVEGIKKGLDACEALSSIVEYAESYGITGDIVVDLGLARGLDYYTGPVFEVYAEGFENEGSIAGGGRYDELIEIFGGEPTPVTGVSLGLDRLVALLERTGVFEDLNLAPRVYVVSASESVRPKAIEVTQQLRRAGVSTDMDLLSRGMRKQLDNANTKGVSKVVIVGERELAEGCVAVRDMSTAEQKKVKIEELLEYV